MLHAYVHNLKLKNATISMVFQYWVTIKVLLAEFYFHKPITAPRTISFLLFHTFCIVHRSVLTVKNLMKVKAQQSFKKFHW